MKISMFKSSFAPDIVCAIPSDGAVPAFITEAKWTFVGMADSDRVGGMSGPQRKTLEQIGHLIFQQSPAE